MLILFPCNIDNSKIELLFCVGLRMFLRPLPHFWGWIRKEIKISYEMKYKILSFPYLILSNYYMLQGRGLSLAHGSW